MSTILARRLKASRAQPVLVRAAMGSLDLNIDLARDTVQKQEEINSWTALDLEYDSSSASSSSFSSASSSSESSMSSIFFEDMPEKPAALDPENISVISCPACEGDSEAEECWNEHVAISAFHREVPSSRSHREGSRRSRSSSSSSSKSRRATPPSATVCPPSSFRPSARSSRRKQVPSSSPPTSSSSSSSDEEAAPSVSKSKLRRSKRLADCECDPLACPPSPHPQAVELCPVVESRLRTTVNPSFYLIYTLENVMMRERKIRYPLKDRGTHLSFGTCPGSLARSPLRSELFNRQS